ncbi:hypothetical protein PLESTB_001959300 [Pleodorina starrii]|uniref:DOT1 domain-containing protein n=1 Tax=Pleodorina starrii TaxID=330485 RepID=A0A9W6C5Y8_9CHLO|nr:hypothetical protein PLESTB_001959300 [Pleodorina starrii]
MTGGTGIKGLYGTLTCLSIQLCLYAMVRKAGLRRSSVFVDIGSGINRVLFHALLYPAVEWAFGIEFDSVKVLKAVAAFDYLMQKMPVFKAAMKNKSAPPKANCASISEVGTLSPATHAFTFWVGMSKAAKMAIGRLWNNCPSLKVSSPPPPPSPAPPPPPLPPPSRPPPPLLPPLPPPPPPPPLLPPLLPPPPPLPPAPPPPTLFPRAADNLLHTASASTSAATTATATAAASPTAASPPPSPAPPPPPLPSPSRPPPPLPPPPPPPPPLLPPPPPLPPAPPPPTLFPRAADNLLRLHCRHLCRRRRPFLRLPHSHRGHCPLSAAAAAAATSAATSAAAADPFCASPTPTAATAPCPPPPLPPPH